MLKQGTEKKEKKERIKLYASVDPHVNAKILALVEEKGFSKPKVIELLILTGLDALGE